MVCHGGFSVPRLYSESHGEYAWGGGPQLHFDGCRPRRHSGGKILYPPWRRVTSVSKLHRAPL